MLAQGSFERIRRMGVSDEETDDIDFVRDRREHIGGVAGERRRRRGGPAV
jgi:hypothetical protein